MGIFLFRPLRLEVQGNKMSSHIMRLALRAPLNKIPQRALSTSPICSKAVVLDQSLRDEIHPKIGNREIVGFGSNGNSIYWDHPGYPCPAIRFKEPTAEVEKLQEKEKGDWKSLSLAEKKTLYRHSFCQTYSEMEAPTGEWKQLVAMCILAFGLTGWILYFMKTQVYGPLPYSFTPEFRRKVLKRQIDEGQGHLYGLASKWDYEKLRWKD